MFSPATIRAALPLARARVSFPHFFELVGRDRRGRRMEFNPRLRLMDDTVTAAWAAGRHVSIVAPPGEGKSTYARLRLLWEMGRDPLKNFAVISAVNGTAKGAVSLVRALIASTDLEGGPSMVRRVFPELVPDYEAENRRDVRGWQVSEFYLRRGDAQAADPAIFAAPVVITSEARRIDLALFDDVMTRVIANSTVQREEAIKATFDTWLEGRLVDCGVRGRAIFLQNCWNTEDLAHRFLTHAGVTSLWLGINDASTAFLIRLATPPEGHPLLVDPARYGATPIGNEDGSLLFEMPFPEAHPVYNQEALREQERRNPATFQRAWRHRALSDRDVMFPSWPRRQRTPGTVASVLRLPTTPTGRVVLGPAERQRLTIAAGYDISSRKRSGNWLCVVGADVHGKRCILEHRRGAWSPGEAAQVIAETYQRLPWDLLHVEDVGVQDQLLAALREHALARAFVHTISGFTTGANKYSEEIGLPALDLLIENGTYLWPDGEAKPGATEAEAWTEFSQAMLRTPRVVPPGGTHDGIMSWWFADRALTRLGLPGGQGSPVSSNGRGEMDAGLSGY